MDLRIGVTQAPRELVLELADDIDRDHLRAEIESTLAEEDRILWLSDKKGREVAVPVRKIAYVEMGAPASPRIGFGG